MRPDLRVTALRRLSVAAVVSTLLLTLLPGVAVADTKSYTASEIEDWLTDKIATTVFEVTTAPSVTLNATEHFIFVEDFTLEFRGVTVGLNALKLTTTCAS
jgi:hypothetical protein